MQQLPLLLMLSLQVSQEVETGIAAGNIEECLDVFDVIEIGTQLPELDKDIGRYIFRIFPFRDELPDKGIQGEVIRIIDSRKRLGITMVKLKYKIVIRLLHQKKAFGSQYGVAKVG